MHNTAPAAHSSHDEPLIARLYGGDVSEIERARALDLVAQCPECGVLFADLGAIAAATARMPVPARPRDFALTEADAARLREKPHRRLAIFGPQFRRSLGGALTALGLVGVVLTGTASLLGGGAGVGMMAGDQRAASYESGGTGVAGPVGINRESSNAPLAPAASAAASDASTVDYSTSQPPASQTQTSKTSLASGGPSSLGTGGEVFGGANAGGPPSTPTGQTDQGGFDARLVWLGGFGALFGIGLAILLVPRFVRGRRRGLGRSG